MNVVHLDHSASWRGGQTQLAHLLDGPDRPVICRSGSALHQALQARSLPHMTHDDWLTPWGIARLSQKIRSLDPELVAAHTSTAHGAAIRATRLPVVVHRRVDFKPSWTSRRKYRRAQGFISVSDAVSNILHAHGVPKHRILTVPDGVDVQAVEEASATSDPKGWATSADTPCLLAVGALVDHKDHQTLLRALTHVPHARLLIVGEGRLRRHLTRSARQLKLDDRVQFLGVRDDVFGLLKSVDLFVHPSKLEGRGQAVIEALLAGTPVVSTSAGGIPETVGAGGRLVPPQRPVQMAAAIQATLSHMEQARSLARERRDAIKEWANISTYKRRTYEAYEHFVSLTTHNDNGAIQGAGSDLNDARRFPTT